MFSALSNWIKVTATPSYQGESLDENELYSIWSYNIVIENRGNTTIKILSRYWKIIDSNGLIHEVTGEGIIGKKPIIRPGELFEYTSFTNLKTTSGLMVGKYYALEVQTGKKVEIDIPAFSLDNPEEEKLLN
jgi:ApaG protein